MAIRNFVLKLVQKGSGKRTHVTIEQEAGGGVEPSPNAEYTFSKFFNGTYNEVISYKQIDGGEKIAVDWSVGAIEGNGADLIEIIRHRDGFEIKKKVNHSPEEKQYLFYIIQAESGKKIGFSGTIEGKEYVFRKDREAGIIQPNEKNFKYVITSTCNGSFVNYKMTISGEGKEYIKCVFLDKIHQEVAENSNKKHYIYIQHLENSTGKDLPYVISLTQNESGRKLEINGVVKKDSVTPGDDDLKRNLLITKRMQKYTSPDDSCIFGIDPKTNQRDALCTYFNIINLKEGDTIEAMVRYQLIKKITSNGGAYCGLMTRVLHEDNWYEAVAKAENINMPNVEFGEELNTPFDKLEVSDTPTDGLLNIIKVWDIKVKNKDGLECAVDVKMMGGGKPIDPVW